MVSRVSQHIVNFFNAIDRIFAVIVTVVLITCLFAMVFLVFYQVIMRNFFDSGLVWGEIATRNLVIWIAFLGASLATRSRQHISVDFLTRLIPNTPREVIRFLFDGLACFITFLLALAALKFVQDERLMGAMLFGDIPMWTVQVIIPFGFALISLQYAIGMYLDVQRLVVKKRPRW